MGLIYLNFVKNIFERKILETRTTGYIVLYITK